jgi:hypothetical protein
VNEAVVRSGLGNVGVDEIQGMIRAGVDGQVAWLGGSDGFGMVFTKRAHIAGRCVVDLGR